MRLSAATLDRLPAGIDRFGYDRAAQAVGIVHFGIGAFHRAHQAVYCDRAMDAGQRDWMICGVSLRSAEVADQLNPQDGLYTVAERSENGTRLRVVGAVREVLVATASPEAVIDRIAAPATRIISFTVTEKGYCRAADGTLDPALAGESSLYRFVAEGLARRRAAGLRGVTLLSCDNLADNGPQLERLMQAYLAARDPALAGWVADHCRFPMTMIDRIVPATTVEDRDAAQAATGLRDEGMIATEPFSQWVIEDRFAGPRPRWEEVGAQLVADVAPYETAKLRMLNGAHSAIAYLGLQRGHAHVHEAVADPGLREMAERLMRREAAPTIAAAPGQDLSAYADRLMARFANPALPHRLIQIAMDGSQKIPQRWLGTLAASRASGHECPVILTALGAWLGHVRGDNAARWGAVDDPLAGDLTALWQGKDALQVATALFSPGGLMAGTWQGAPQDLVRIAAAVPARG
ncbi:mannitol dehydrogenase family protein [Sphingobium sp. JS3065]|uniref:mannitol dehydrogenase family protein n=1 Tax=Sphingobium sp. JS3065 TaxID=2970925 RepID=UPI0022650F25|nr:mannitol dehydrogenase family protein [Sphingobium sp. JS3065]UZW57737.1 mannitol dehydrogenase family protein [Sphingobium sp. JS3065]